VEQLLERVVETQSDAGDAGETSENISDRLERLSSAFDAIQKYLEEQSSPNPGVSAAFK
jgi:methyl-accepting chemotaxis protein